MSVLMTDLAEERSASNRRAAHRLAEEARTLNERRVLEEEQEALRNRVAESARQAADYAIAGVAEAESDWQLVLGVLRRKPTGQGAESLLRACLDLFVSYQDLVTAARPLADLAREQGCGPEHGEELDKAERRLQQMAEEVRLGLQHRTTDWQPADPDRLALGLRLAREGRTVKADEARARFRRTGG